jgi:hypothetical protein
MTTDRSYDRVVRDKAIRTQIFGCMLVGLASITAILARVVGFELDIFYVVIAATGAGLFLYGTIKREFPR